MKIAAIASISFFENDITQMIIQVEDDATWKDVFAKACEDGLYGDDPDRNQKEWIMGLPDSLDEARGELGDGEMDISVVFLEAI